MILHWDIEQRTPEWHAIRWGKVTGTRSEGLLGKSGTLLRDILSEQLEEYDPTAEDEGYTSPAMQRGLDLEPHARAWLSERIGIELLECGFISSTTHPLLGISPDGVSKVGVVMCEMKNPGKEAHTQMLMDNFVDKKYLPQIIHAFATNELLETHYFLSYRPESMKNAFVQEFTLETVVDLGTKAKPVLKTIAEWVAIEYTNLGTLEKELKEKFDQITGI